MSVAVLKTVSQGETIWLDGKQSLTLGQLIKSGGAGCVYLLPGSPAQVAQLYHPHLDRAANRRKLDAMLELTPELPDKLENGRRYVQIAWPQAAVHDRQGEFLGFVMPLLDMAHTAELEQVLQERQARAAGLPVGLGAKVTLAANLAGVLAALHQQHHYVVDLKPVNLRFYRDSLTIAMLDCDGFSIQGKGERYKAEQFTSDYLAPEVQRKGLPAGSEAAQDRFALAVVIFQLLNFGIHPYSGRPASAQVPTDIPGRIRDGYYAYGARRHKGIAPNVTSGHALMPPEVRALFDRAFGKQGSARPSATDWAQLLRKLALRHADPAQNGIVVCRLNAGHQHFAGLGCAACARETAIAAAGAASLAAQAQIQAQPPSSPPARRASRVAPVLPPAQAPLPSAGVSGKSWVVIVILIVLFLIGFSAYTSAPTTQAQKQADAVLAQQNASIYQLQWQQRSRIVAEPSAVRASIRTLDKALEDQRDADVQLGLQLLYNLQADEQGGDPALSRLRRTLMEASGWGFGMDAVQADNMRDQLIAHPRDYLAANALGSMHLALRETEAARQYFEQAIWGLPTDAVAWLGLSATALRSNAPRQAVRMAALAYLSAVRHPEAGGQGNIDMRIHRSTTTLGLAMPPEARKQWTAVLADGQQEMVRLAALPRLADRPAGVGRDTLHPVLYDDEGPLKLAGDSTLTISIDAAGVPQKIVASKPAHEKLNNAWLEQAKKWRYLPAISKGQLQASTVEVLVRYRDGKSSFSAAPAPAPAAAAGAAP